MMRFLALSACCLLLPVSAAAQDASGAFSNVFSPGSWEGTKAGAAAASAGPAQQARPSRQERRAQAQTQQPMMQDIPEPPSQPLYAVTPQPLILPTTEEPPINDSAVFRPAAPDDELDLPPEIGRMLQNYDAAIGKLPAEQRAYVENLVREGHKLDEPLHQALIKSMDWNICARSNLMSAAAKLYYEKYRENEEKIYLENVSAFENGVLSKVGFMDTKIIRDKITAQGVASLAAMKQLYLVEASKASPQQTRQNCEALASFLRDYGAQGIFAAGP